MAEDITNKDIDDLIDTVISAIDGNKETFNIDPKNYQPEDIKLTDYSLDNIFDKTPIQVAEPLIVSLAGYEIKEIRFKRQGTTHRTTIHIVEYPTPRDMDDMKHPINVQKIFLQLFSVLVLEKRTDNILLPIINVDVKGSDITNAKVTPYIENSKYYSISVTERFNRLVSLEQFFEQNKVTERVIKEVCRQVIDVIYHIATAYPKYCNDLLEPKYISCYIKDNLPVIKLDTFYGSAIPGIIDNTYVKQSRAVDNVKSFLEQLSTKYQTDVDSWPRLVEFFERAKDVNTLKDLRNDSYFKEQRGNAPEKKSQGTSIAMSNKTKQSRHIKPKVYKGQRRLYQPSESYQPTQSIADALGGFNQQYYEQQLQQAMMQQQMAQPQQMVQQNQMGLGQMPQQQYQQPTMDQNYMQYMAAMQQQQPFDPTFQTLQQGGGQKPFFFNRR